MRFLIVTKGRDPVPPEMAMPMMQMMQGWMAEDRSSGKLEQVWSFAGQLGGGGIANVDSHEELDELMAGFPFGQTDIPCRRLSACRSRRRLGGRLGRHSSDDGGSRAGTDA